MSKNMNIYVPKEKKIHPNMNPEKFFELQGIKESLHRTAAEIIKAESAKPHLKGKELAMLFLETKEPLTVSNIQKVVYIMDDAKAQAQFERLTKS